MDYLEELKQKSDGFKAAGETPPVVETPPVENNAPPTNIPPVVPAVEVIPPVESNIPPVETSPVVPATLEINDDATLAYLSEKHGITAGSLSELAEKLNAVPVEHEYANDESKLIDKYVRETGRPAADYFKMGADYETLDKIQRVVDHKMAEFPALTEEMVRVSMNLDLEPLNIEDHDQADVDARNREIVLRDHSLIMEDQKARTAFNEQKQAYAAPTEDLSQRNAGTKMWNEGISEVVANFDLGIEGYTYEPKNLAERYNSLESVLGQFADKNGENFDYEKFVRAVETGLNRDSIVNAVRGAGDTSGQKGVLAELSNTTKPGIKTGEPPVKVELGPEHQESMGQIGKLFKL